MRGGPVHLFCNNKTEFEPHESGQHISQKDIDFFPNINLTTVQ